MSGYNVSPDELRAYSNKLKGQQDTAGSIAGLVDQADVGDESWGVVGLFVKDSYTEMLTELQSMFDELKNGLDNGSAKFSEAAKAYDEGEQWVNGLLNDINGKIEAA